MKQTMQVIDSYYPTDSGKILYSGVAVEAGE